MKKIVFFLVGFLFMAVNLYAADGDFIIDGNLGVGTLSPAKPLHVVTSALSSGVKVESTNAGTNGASVVLYQNSASPAANDIAGRVQFNGKRDDGSEYWMAYIDGVWTDPTAAVGTSKMVFHTRSGDTDNTAMTIDPNGNVGIGTTTPATELEVEGDILIRQLATYPDIFWGTTNGYYNFRTSAMRTTNAWSVARGGTDESAEDDTYADILTVSASPPQVTVAPGWNVGIGTTNPQGYQLYVAGDAYSTVGWFSPSDIKFKENIEQIESPLDTILNIAGVSYTWKREEYHDKGFPEGRHYGVIAQEVQKVLPEIVKEGPSGGKAVAYSEIIPVLIEAIKEQHKIVQEQQKEITALKVEQQTMKDQQAMISVLFEKVNELEKQVESRGTVALADY